MNKKTKIKKPEQASVDQAWKNTFLHLWDYEDFVDFVNTVYQDGYKYGVQDIKDNYILKSR